MEILIPVIIMAIMGLVFGAILAYASKKFEVKLDERIETVVHLLPGVNCAGCGYPGCFPYAEAIVLNNAPTNLCSAGGSTVAKALSDAMGSEGSATVEKRVARVLCRGDNTKTTKKYELDSTIKTCVVANLNFWGDKSCNYGCVGYGDCERICPFDAIHVNEKGIAVVDEEKCTACNKCVAACPEHIIKIVPKKSRFTVCCSSKDKGINKKKVCEVSCIACGICAKNCPVQAITVDNNIAVIDPSKCVNCSICELKCPTNAIVGDIKERKKAKIDEEKCIGCTLCKKVCPVDAIEGEVKQKHRILVDKCVGCEQCVEKCPKKAISIDVTVIKK